MKVLIIVFGFIGILYGIATGIPLGRYLCAWFILKRNATSEGDNVTASYSTRGVEVFNSSMEQELAPLSWQEPKGKSARNKLSAEEKKERENLEYFKRNMI